MMRKVMVSMAWLALTNSRAQEYVPVTTDGSRWLYHVITQFGVHLLEGYDITGDTTIEGETYDILESWGPMGGLRDDSGRVWYYPFDEYVQDQLDTLPVLLYDLNLSVGDSFPVPCFPGTWAHVTDRDSVQLFDGTYRTRLQLAPITGPDFILSSGEWVEGIGDPDYLLWALWDLWEVGIWLECYGIDSDPLFGSCLYLGQQDVTVENRFGLVSSGFYGRFGITGPVERIQGLAVCDAIGREIGAASTLRGEIELSRYVAGIYFLRISSSTGPQTIRFCLPQQ